MIAKNAKYNLLVKQYKNHIYRYALYMLKDRMDADDAAQEVLIKLWQNMGKFNMGSAKPWIYRTTHNLCIDYIRKRRPLYQIDEEFNEAYKSDEVKSDPFLTTHLKMMTAKIKEMIKMLPENLRSVFVLYEIEGLKYKEISETLEIPINTVKVQLLRARKKLQEELRNYERN